MAEGGSLGVEGNAQRLRLPLVQQLEQDREKAVNGMGRLPVPGGEGTHTVEGAV
ncbi:hypothetical protein SDC9_207707 [bioreactor metagenome]|uniref:Uncharacterized protein n=1 Tax=bioreactor metagenome TaxID=1076179 RepID=A0A645JI34_9ZZZZ